MDFRYTVDVNSDEPVMLLNKHIGFDSEDGMGIDGSSFQSELLYLDSLGKNRIKVRINSPGGSVLDGMGIYNAILTSKTKVDTYCDGIAASIAGVIFQAGRNRIMSDYGLLMYHNPYNPNGTEDEGLSKIKESLAVMICSRCGKTPDEVKVMMDKTSWITASEAMESGMCDRVESSSDYNKKRMVAAGQDMKAYWKESNLVLNSLFNKNKNMIKVANKLGLNPESNEETILNAVTEIQNKLTETETKNKSNEDKILELEISAEAKQKELETISNELAELKNKATEAEEALKTANAESLVSEAVNAGKIKEEGKATWLNMAKNDLEGVKAMIEALPLNKVAPKLEEEAPKAPYSMAASMIEIQNRNKK